MILCQTKLHDRVLANENAGCHELFTELNYGNAEVAHRGLSERHFITTSVFRAGLLCNAASAMSQRPWLHVTQNEPDRQTESICEKPAGRIQKELVSMIAQRDNGAISATFRRGLATFSIRPFAPGGSLNRLHAKSAALWHGLKGTMRTIASRCVSYGSAPCVTENTTENREWVWVYGLKEVPRP